MKKCDFCNAEGHTKFYCRLRPRTSIQRHKRLHTYGKHAYLWDEARRLWIEANGGSHPCHYCGIWLSDDPMVYGFSGVKQLTLDHLDSRSRSPELRYVPVNLIPACGNCNRKKAARSHDEFPHTCHTDLHVLG